MLKKKNACRIFCVFEKPSKCDISCASHVIIHPFVSIWVPHEVRVPPVVDPIEVEPLGAAVVFGEDASEDGRGFGQSPTLPDKL